MAGRGLWSKLLRSLFCAAFVVTAVPVSAQQPPAPPASTAPYPAASNGSALASAGLAGRKDWIIRHSACGREDHYVELIAAERAGNFDSQGEGFINLLGAKAAYLVAHPNQACLAPLTSAASNSRPDCDVVTFDNSAPPQLVISVSRDCMIKQINEGILVLRKDAVLGSSDLVCLTKPSFKSHGEFDVEVRELVASSTWADGMARTF